MARYAKYVLTALLGALLLTGCSARPEQPLSSDEAVAKSVSSYTRLGFAYLERDNRERAKRALVKALSLDEDSAQALHGMALIYQREGEAELAERYFQQALDEGGQFSVARNNYAAFLYQQARYREACDQLQQTVSDTLYVNRPLAFENLGRCHLQLKQPQQAEAAFKKALQLDRNAERALLELALLKQQQNQLPDAWGYFQQHMKVAKASERSLMLGIRLAEQLGKPAERSRYLSQLSQLKSAR